MPPTSQRPDPTLAPSTTAAGLLAAVSALVARLEDGASGPGEGADAQVARVLDRLRASVLRPLQQVAGTVEEAADPAAATGRADDSQDPGSVRQRAVPATQLR